MIRSTHYYYGTKTGKKRLFHRELPGVLVVSKGGVSNPYVHSGLWGSPSIHG